MALEESKDDTDTVIETEKLRFLIGQHTTPYVENTKLDYVKSVFGFGQFKLLRV
ncbi:MAG: hypothetical protein H0Z32_01490 [Bacillaceae bacterium]|nr:hypothetical protein [Bacillaceae bacterium]